MAIIINGYHRESSGGNGLEMRCAGTAASRALGMFLYILGLLLSLY